MPASSEKGTLTYGKHTIPYVIVRSPSRLRTMEITVHGEGVRVSVPVRVGKHEVRQFVSSRAGWILRTKEEIASRPKPLRYVTGERVSFLGDKLRLVVEDTDALRTSVRFQGSELLISVPETLMRTERKESMRKAVMSWYKRRAHRDLVERVAYWRRRIACRKKTKVIVKDQRSRWGSCGADGTLRFNWRIVMAEPDLIDYLVVHELLHVRIRSHSPRFRAALAEVMPDYRSRELRLNDFGRRMAV